ncbi:4Fe-4S binding protein [Actinotalea sp. M2MS4P-6]|uniref:NADH-ubiquinone oxidoreductase-F iron-sulfur binding region domain-containing protein n=1 Tax=Actinotalea sp. M2MS4P-6 TaxID=2983762 RepID=UPI0021E39963|nr:NADH-ubiquinone oxidoreductase-F iron-sulfur binding region domain-containing protein [Actinotalea sp. M2MS4P-6]MCV2394311.1 4Fe-4S binding protein [Actinotalea sp. M2MS4P-6]
MRCETTAANLTPIDVEAVAAGVACPVAMATTLMWQAAGATCGREVYCREGTRQVATILTDITVGKGSSADLALVDELCGLMADLVPCAMAGLAARSVLDSLRDHAEEWDRHVRRSRCTSLTCAMSFTVHVDPTTCTGCEECRPVCPVDAIAGGPDLVHVVDNDVCTRCGACLSVCPVSAIAKAGPIKPKVPDEPIPVGSFAAAPVPAGGGMRRRRPRPS